MKITLKSVLTGTVFTSAIISSMVSMSAPAQALELTSGNQLDISSLVSVTQTVADVYDFDFGTATTLGSDPFVAIDPITISDLMGVAVGVATPPSVPFIAGIALTDTTNVNFNLAKAILSDDGGDLDLLLFGNFVNAANDILASGHLSVNFAPIGLPGVGETATGSISASLVVVPTPAAVLPGLIGMSTAVFRKKKQEEDADLATIGTEAQA